MTAEARQRYHSDINKKLSMQDPNLEGVAQAEDSNHKHHAAREKDKADNLH